MSRARLRWRTLGLAAAIAASLAVAPHRAPADPTVQQARDKILPLLQGIESVPTRKQLDTAALVDAAPALRDIAGDPTAPTSARLHAYAALANYPGPEILAFLRATVSTLSSSNMGVNTLYLRASARSLAVVGGVTQLDVLGPLLAHPVADVRADAADALAATLSPRALPLLRARLPHETDAMVRLALAKAIRALS